MGMKNSQAGASALELALVLPLLVMILVGTIEFGFIMYDKAVITNASREAARKGIVFRQACGDNGVDTWGTATAEMVTAASSYGATHLVSLGGGNTPLAVAITGNCCNAGSTLTVNVTYPYKFLVLPNFGKTLPSELALNGVTVMNCENQ